MPPPGTWFLLKLILFPILPINHSKKMYPPEEDKAKRRIKNRFRNKIIPRLCMHISLLKSRVFPIRF